MGPFLPTLLSVIFTLLSSIEVTESKEFMRVCYFTSWSNHRSSRYSRFDIEDIDASLCTHIIYAFAKLDRISKLMVPAEPLVEDSRPGYVGRYRQFTDLKNKHRHLKTMLSIGGQYAGNSGFEIITENDVILQRFAKATVEFLRSRNFDGIDIDWEYPAKETRRAFVNLLQALRQAFDAEDTSHKLLLSVAGPAGLWTIDPGYDIPSIARFVDFVNLMTYDYHVGGSRVAAFNSPLYSRKDVRFHPTLSTNWTVHYWLSKGLPLSKTVVGVTGVGRRYVLADANDTLVGSLVTKEARKGNFYSIASGLAYPEICILQDSESTTKYYDIEQAVPYMVNGDDWIGYEDPMSLKGKVEWMLKVGVAGIMMWSLDQDDFTGQACNDGKYPLLTAIAEAVGADRNTDSTDQSEASTTSKTESSSNAASISTATFSTRSSTTRIPITTSTSSTSSRKVATTSGAHGQNGDGGETNKVDGSSYSTISDNERNTNGVQTTIATITTTSASRLITYNICLIFACWLLIHKVIR